MSRVGIDSAIEIRRALRDLCEIVGSESVYLELPLSQAGMPDLCVQVEEEGFFFGGVGPHFAPDGDTLRLQFLATDLDLSRLQTVNPFGGELLRYVSAERTRVGKYRRSESC